MKKVLISKELLSEVLGYPKTIEMVSSYMGVQTSHGFEQICILKITHIENNVLYFNINTIGLGVASINISKLVQLLHGMSNRTCSEQIQKEIREAIQELEIHQELNSCDNLNLKNNERL